MPDRRAVFFDRDGTLMDEVNYCNNPIDVRAIPGAVAQLQKLRSAGWLNIIITNQSGLSSGKITMSQYIAVNAELDRQLEELIDAVYFCPDSSTRPTLRRKPSPGMLVEAARDHDIDLSKSWMIGDKNIDVQCGRAAGCRTILVRTGHGENQTGAEADFTAGNVVEAIDILFTECPL
jgi:D-glycero-D-manno-heptose 1,7-bisphosphate phosphatase